MRVFERTASAIALDRDGLALSQTPGAAGPLTLTAATTLDPPRQVAVYSGSNIAARVFTVVGTDRSGNSITDTVTGINNSTVSTTKIFKTVVSITVDAATGAAVEAGWTDVSYTSWVILGNYRSHYTSRLVAIVAGTVSYEVEATSQNMYRDRVTGEYPDQISVIVAAGAVTTDTVLQAPYAAVRIRKISGTGSVKLRVLPSATV